MTIFAVLVSVVALVLACVALARTSQSEIFEDISDEGTPMIGAIERSRALHLAASKKRWEGELG